MSGRYILKAKRRITKRNPARLELHANPVGASTSSIIDQLQAITSEDGTKEGLAEEQEGPPLKLSRDRVDVDEECKYQDLVKFDESVNEALEKNNREQLKEILSSATSSDQLQRLSHKFLMCIFRHELNKIKCLVESGLPFNSLDECSHVHHHVLAMDQGHSDIAAYLIEQGADVNVTRPGTVSLAHVACRRNDYDFLQVLISNNCNIDAQCSVGFTPLMYACRYGSTECVQKLLESGVSLNLTEKVFGRSALHFAAEKKDPFVSEILQMLLDAGIDPNITDRSGQPAVVYLIKNSESTPFSFDCLIPASVKWLNINIESIKGTITHLVAEQGRISTLKSIVACGADLSLKDNQGRTIAHKAALSMCDETFCYAITLPHCDVNAQDNNGNTPLHLLTTQMSPLHTMESCWAEDVVPLLAERGQNFNLQNSIGATPLILSLRTDYTAHISGQLVEKLIPLSDVYVKDRSNQDALQLFIRLLQRDSNLALGSDILRQFQNAGMDVAHYFKTYGREAFVSLASRRDNISYAMLRELINAGVDINLMQYEESALFCALKYSSRVTLCILLLNNASFKVINATQNAAIYSCCCHDRGILNLIIQAGFNGRSIENLLQRDACVSDSDKPPDNAALEILDLIRSVPSLIRLSCRKIREHLPSVKAVEKLKTLPLPPLLINRVRYQDLISCMNPSHAEQVQIDRYS